MTQNKKYLLRKIGKRVCHVAMTISTVAVAAATVVSADEVVAPTDANATTTTEAPATVMEAPTTATPVTEAPTNTVTDVAPATTATPTTEAPVTEAPTTAALVTEAPVNNKVEKSTNIDELLRPETNQSAQITVTTQLYKGREGGTDTVPTGEPKVEKASTTRSNADARANAMVVDAVNKIQQSNNGNALEIDGVNYRVSSYSVATESKTVDGVQVLNYSVNVYTEHFEGNFDRRVSTYELTVSDETGATVEEKHKTEEGTSGLNTHEIYADQAKYALGSIVENNGKSYRVTWNQQTTAKIESIDTNEDQQSINFGMEVRLKPITKYPTEILMFQINDSNGNVIRGPRRAEITTGHAESIFNIGDKIVEGGKNYVVAGRSMSHSKEDLPTGEVQTFLYKITLKEDAQNQVEEKSNVKVITNDGTTLLDYNPVTEGWKAGSEYRVKDEVTVNGKKYVVTNIEGNVSRTRNEANTADVEVSSTVVTVREVTTKPVQYVATVDYVVGGELIKQVTVLTGTAETKEQADAQLNSQSNLMQAMLGKEFEMNGKKYKIKAIRDIERENFDETNKVFLSLKMVYDLEEVAKAAENPSEYPRAEAPGTETDQPSEDVKPSEEAPTTNVEQPSEEAPNTNVEQPSEVKPSEDVKPSEEAPKPSEDVKPSNDVKPSVEAPKEDKKASSSEAKQEKVAPKKEEKQLPNTSVDSLVGVLGTGFVALLGGLGLKIKKDHTK